MTRQRSCGTRFTGARRTSPTAADTSSPSPTSNERADRAGDSGQGKREASVHDQQVRASGGIRLSREGAELVTPDLADGARFRGFSFAGPAADDADLDRAKGDFAAGRRSEGLLIEADMRLLGLPG